MEGPCGMQKSRGVKVPRLEPAYPKADQGSNGEHADEYPPGKIIFYASLNLVPILAGNALVLSRPGRPRQGRALYTGRLTCVPALCKPNLDRQCCQSMCRPLDLAIMPQRFRREGAGAVRFLQRC